MVSIQAARCPHSTRRVLAESPLTPRSPPVRPVSPPSFIRTIRRGKWDLALTRQWLSGRPRRDHLSLLLGRPGGRILHRDRRRYRSRMGCGTARISANRRSYRRSTGAHDGRHLGYALARSVRGGQIWRANSAWSGHEHRGYGSILRRRWGVLEAQAIGSFSITISTFVVSMALMYAIKDAFRLRVPTDGEIEGLDLHEHGIPAYPEYVVTGNDGCPEEHRRGPGRQAHGHQAATDRNEDKRADRHNKLASCFTGLADFYPRLMLIIMKLKLLLLRIASKMSDLYQPHVFWRKLDRAMALREHGGNRRRWSAGDRGPNHAAYRVGCARNPSLGSRSERRRS